MKAHFFNKDGDYEFSKDIPEPHPPQYKLFKNLIRGDHFEGDFPQEDAGKLEKYRAISFLRCCRFGPRIATIYQKECK